MTRRTLYLSLVATTVALGACRGKPEPAPAPAPVAAPVQPVGPSAAEIAAGEAAKRRADSIAAARATAAANAAADAERTAASMKETLAKPVYFDYNKDVIRDDARGDLDAKAAILSANPTVTYLIVGHTDEQGTAEYNLALGQRRAAQVKRYLASKGVDDARFTTQSMGDTQPAAKGTDELSYQLNRRAEFQSSNLPGVMTRPRD
jgi:outer membrane protein OmpA-like peptidoglycan-associated protein